MQNKKNFYWSISITTFLLLFLAGFYLGFIIYNQSQDIYRFLREISKLELTRIYEKMDSSSNVEDLQELLDIEIFGGEGYVHIIDSEGNIIVRSSNPYSNPNVNNIFELVYPNEKIETTLKRDLEEGKEGNIRFTFKDSSIQKVAYYIPVGKEKLSLLVVVTQNYINAKFSQTLYLSGLFMASTVLGLVVLMVYINSLKEKNAEEIKKLKYIDTLSGKAVSKKMLKLKEDYIVSKQEFKKAIIDGIRKDEFEIYLQPQVDCQTGKAVQAEVLVRWNSSSYGFLMPDQFIPFCEMENLIPELDFYLLKKICLLAQTWKGSPIRFSINQSILTLYEQDYFSKFSKILREYKQETSKIEVEITEGSVIDNIDILTEAIENFHKLGISVAMDDFGSGYSSFNILKRLNLDVLKLDKELIRGFSNTSKEKLILETIFWMAKELGMKTVAEGVEGREEVEFLKSVGCDLLQGYYFSKPIPVSEFIEYCRKQED